MAHITQTKHERTIAKFINPSSPPQTLYDIGVGPKTEWKTLAAVYPGMRIFGCEPNPAMYAKLTPVFPGPLAQVAISSREGEVDLHCSPDDPKIATLFDARYAPQVVKVKAWTLDRFDKQMGEQERIILWMDIEGSELDALQSGKELLASGRVRWINLEERRPGVPTVQGWCTGAEIKEFLSSVGYERVCDYNRHSTHQDVIYRHRDEPGRKK